MYRVWLISMPFAALQFPSLALTQLKSLIRAEHGDAIDVTLLYANHDFARLPGYERYQELATSVRHGLTGLGEWLFRQTAFPDLSENADAYFTRCYPTRDKPTDLLRQAVLQLRGQVNGWLDQLIEKYALDQADLVGMSSMFAQNLACLALAHKLKLRNPTITTVMGGANCEFPMGRELVQNVPSIDFVFSGPGLQSFPRFLRHRLEGQPEACHRIDGVFSRKNTSAEPGSAARIEGPSADDRPTVGVYGAERNVDETIPLDYEDYLESAAQWDRDQPALLFETSRGCWWGERAHCTFCGLNGLTMHYRPMSAKQALRQFKDLFRYASRLPRLTLQCVDNIMPRQYVQDLLPRLQTPPNVEIFYEVRSDLSERDVAVLADARVRSIQPGIESLATSTLKLMKKGTTAFQGIRLLKNCRRHEVVPQWNLLIGFPGETQEVYEKYQRELPRLYHLPPPTGAFPVRFDRYSPYFSQAEAYGLDLRPYDFYDLVYPFPTESLNRLAYYFIDNNFKAEYFVQMVQWIGRVSQQVAQWRIRYAGQDDGEPAALFWGQAGDRRFVIDTRCGSRREHAINSRCQRILESLQRPLDTTRLAAEMNDLDRRSVERELGYLLDRGLLFEENGRFLNLVMSSSQNSNSSSDSPTTSASRAQRIVSM